MGGLDSLQISDLRGRGAWQERGGGVFEKGVGIPMHTMKIHIQ